MQFWIQRADIHSHTWRGNIYRNSYLVQNLLYTLTIQYNVLTPAWREEPSASLPTSLYILHPLSSWYLYFHPATVRDILSTPFPEPPPFVRDTYLLPPAYYLQPSTSCVATATYIIQADRQHSQSHPRLIRPSKYNWILYCKVDKVIQFTNILGCNFS